MTPKEFCFDLEQFSENALASKIKNDVIDKLLTCSTKQEIEDTLNSILTENYDSIDIDKIRTGNAVVGAALDSFVVCSLQETSESLTDVQIQVGQLLKNAIDLVCKPPSFNIPGPYPIFDISGDFLKQLLFSLLKVIVKIMVAILKKLLQLIIDICRSGLSLNNFFGGENIVDVLANSIGSSVSEATSFVNEIFGIFGIDPAGVPSGELISGDGCEETSIYDTSFGSTKDFLDDLSSLLTPLEICDLFDGNPSEQSLQAIEELIRYEYSNNMGLAFNSRTRIRELFRLLGSRIDPTFCSTIRENAESILSSPDLCFSDEGRRIRRNFLGSRDLSDEEIESLIDRERDRVRANLESIASLISSIRSDPDRIFGSNQDIFCRNGQPGIITAEQLPHLRDSLSSNLDYTYNIFSDTYIKEINTFAGTLLTQDKKLNEDDPVIPKFTTLTIQDKDGNVQTFNNAINPTFMQRVSFGTFTLCDNNGNSDKSSLTSYYGNAVDDDGNVDIQKIISVTSKKEARELGIADNVYIANYDSIEKIAADLYDNTYGFFFTGSDEENQIRKEVYYNNSETIELVETTRGYLNYRIKDFISYNTSSMSISINIPTKYSPFGEVQTIPDFTTLTSTDNLIVYVTGTI